MTQSSLDKLVYITAFLPASGQSLQALAQTDAKSLLGPSITTPNSGLTLGLIQANITGIFIQDGTTAEQASVTTNYREEPGIPFGDTVKINLCQLWISE